MTASDLSTIEKYLQHLKESVYNKLTVKNYASDLRNFYSFFRNYFPKLTLNEISINTINQYEKHLRDYQASESTIRRRIASLKSFFRWAFVSKIVNQDPFLSNISEITNEKFINQPSIQTEKIVTNKPENIQVKTESIEQKAVILISNLFKTKEIKDSRQTLWKYFSIITTSVAICCLAIFITIKYIAPSFEKESQLDGIILGASAPNILSFQGRLTDENGIPETGLTDMRFQIYTVASGGTSVWDSGSCSIDPDGDGVFSTVLGSTCGSAISDSVFADNATTYLGITAGTDSEMIPRQRIASSAYALNADTLDGFDSSQSPGANNVVVLDASGNLVFGVSGPQITSSSGTFTINGYNLTLQTSNGDISLDPAGGDVTLASGDNLNLSVATNLIFGGTTSLGETTSATDSGAYFVGVFDEFDNFDATDVQTALDEIDADLTSAGTNYWQLSTNVVNPTQATYDFALGGTTLAASMFGLDESAGNFYFGYDNSVNPTLLFEATDADAGSFGFNTYDSFYFSGANVGIGTTAPRALFQINNSGTSVWHGLIIGDYYNGVTGTSGFAFHQDNSTNIAYINQIKDGTGYGDISIANYGGNVGIGTSAITHQLELADHTTAAGGMAFGTDVELYRSAANNLTLASGDSFNLAASTNLIFGGTTSLGEATSATDSGAYFVGVFDEFDNSANDTVQEVLNDLDLAITSGGAGSMWTLSGGVIYPTTVTNDFALGGTTLAASMFGLDESAGNFYFGYDNSVNPTFLFEATDADAGSFGFNTNDAFYFSGANVGIGTTAPTSLLSLYSTSTSTSFTGFGLDWQPGSATTTTGDLFNINIGSNGTASSLFNITDNTSSLFKVTETQITSAVPHAFTSSGDVSMAYNLNFTNETSSYIRTSAPLYLEVGDSYESNSLTLRTYNAGDIIFDAGDASGDTGTIKFYDAYVKGATITTPIAFSDASADINTYRSNFTDETLIGAINETYAAVGGSGSGLWSLASGVIYPTTVTNDFALGGTTLAASMFGLDESAGNFYFGYDNSVNPTLLFEATDADAGSFGFNTYDSFYFSDANVGIGTTAPQAKLEIYDASTYSGMRITAPTGQNTYIDFYEGATFSANIWWDGTSNYFGINSEATPTVINRDGGNVGIGNSNPQTSLDIKSDTTSASLKLNGTGSTYNFSTLELWSDEATDKSWQLAHRQEAGNTNKLMFYYYDGATWTSPFIIDTDGNVGIGTTDPNSLLANTATNNVDVFGNGIATDGNAITWAANATGYVMSLNNSYSSAYGNGLLIDSASTDATTRLLNVESGGVSRFLVDGDGNVGIGTTDPDAIFSVNSGAAQTIGQFTSTGAIGRIDIDSTGNSGFNMNISGSNKWAAATYQGNTGNYDFVFWNSQTLNSSLFIDGDNDYLGIGMAAPTHRLELADHTTTAGGLAFGTDVELYRSAANNLTLASGDSFNLAASTNLIFGGTTSLGEVTSATDSGGYFVGVFDEFDNSANDTVQEVLNDLDLAITSGGAGSMWTLSGGVIYPTTVTNDFALGGTTLAASMFGLDESAGNFYFGYDNSVNPTFLFEATDADAGSFGFNTYDSFYFSDANVGIGTTNPGSKLYVAGEIKAPEVNKVVVVDGVTYAQTCTGINAAIDALGSSGGEIYLPEGSYSCSETITIDYNNTTIKGSGWATIIDSSGLNNTTITTNSRDYLTFKDFIISANISTSDWVYTINTTGSNNITFESISINNAGFAAIYATSTTTDFVVNNCTFTSTSSSNYAILMSSVVEASIISNEISGYTNSISTTGSSRIVISDNSIENSSLSTDCSRCTINNNELYASQITAEGTYSTYSGNAVYGSNTGIRINGDYIKIIGNIINDDGDDWGNGIYVNGDYNSIVENIISTYNGTGENGINIVSGANNNDIRNNRLYNNTTNIADAGTSTTINNIENTNTSFGLDLSPDSTLEIIKHSTNPLFMLSSTANSDGDYLYLGNTGLLGLGTTNPTHKLELTDHTTAAGGMAFGTDVELYRSAANNLTLASGDSFNLAASTNLIFGGATSLGEATSATDSGGYFVGIFDEFANSANDSVQEVLNDFDDAIALRAKYDRVVGTGGTDATLADAITNAPSGGSIFIMPGTYANTNVTIDKPLKIFGAGSTGTILSGAGTSATITISSGIDNVEIYDLKVYNAGTTYAAISLASWSDSDYIILDHLEIHGGNRGIEFYQGNFAKITNNYIHNTNDQGIYANTGALDYSLISNNYISTAGGHSITLAASMHTVISNNVIFDWGASDCGIEFNQNSTYLTAEGNTLNGNNTSLSGICIRDADYNVVKNNVIRNVVGGITITNVGVSSYNDITGNLITNASTVAIHLDDAYATYTYVSDNTMYNNTADILGNTGTNNYVDYTNGANRIFQPYSSIGIGSTGPDAKLDVLATSGEQLRLTHTDSTYYAGFTVSNAGDLSLDLSGGDFNIAANDNLNLVSGTGIYTQTYTHTTATGFNFLADSYTTGTTGAALLSFDALTTGTGLFVDSDSLTGAGTLSRFDANIDGASGNAMMLDLNLTDATTGTAGFNGIDLYVSGTGSGTGAKNAIYINSDSNFTGSLLELDANTSDIFKVTPNQITSSVPHSFTASGDTSMAYDLIMTNQTASSIQSYGPITIEAGESFENNDLTLKAYGTGRVLISGSGFALETSQNFILDSNDSGDTYLTHDATNDRIRYYVDNTEMFRMDTGGNSSNGSISTTLTDLAETYPTYDDKLVAGDLVMIDPAATSKTVSLVKRAEFIGRDSLIGAVSTAPGFILGGGSFSEDFCQEVRNEGIDQAISDYQHDLENIKNEDTIVSEADIDEKVEAKKEAAKSCLAPKKVMVALSGRVPLNVDMVNGDINPGDPLTVSPTIGKAMKANTPGMIVGRALEKVTKKDYDAGKKTVMAIIQVNYWQPGNQTINPNNQNPATTDLSSSEIENLDISKDLHVLGKTVLNETSILDKLTIAGTLTIEDNKINTIGILQVQSLNMSNTEFQGAKIIMTTDGDMKILGTLEVGKIAGSSEMRDSLVFADGQTEYKVQMNWETSPKVVQITPTWNTTFWITDLNEHGFTVHVNTPATENKEIYWVAIW